MPSRKKPVRATASRPRKPARKKGATKARARAKAATKPLRVLAVDIGDLLNQLRPRPAVEFRVSVRRPDDMVVFDLIFENLKRAPVSPPKLIKKDPAAESYFVVEFPPQSFGEQAFLDKTDTNDTGTGTGKPFPETSPIASKNVPSLLEKLPPMPAANIRMAGKSRVAFSMPAGTTELGFDLASVLAACRSWPMRLDPLAAPEPPPFRPRRGTGKTWLKDITRSASWLDATDILVNELKKIAATEIARSVADAAKRIGDEAATALAANKTEGLDARLERLLTAEADALAKQYPQLREGRGRDTTLAALSLKATETLAASKLPFGDDLAFVPFLPFLPVFLSPHLPAPDVTSLELPYRLYVSPIEAARWLHRDTPSTDPRSGRTELWHTRLRTRPQDFGADGDAKMRAIWSPDYPNEDAASQVAPPLPFRMTLDPLDRQMLVKLMAGYDEKIVLNQPRIYTPRPSTVHRLMLSALGGLLDTEGSWDPRPETIFRPQPLTTGRIGLEQWRHLATLGRDHYVRVVYAGYLMPFGHHASLIKVTERKFEASDPLKSATANRVAVLRQRFFIIVRQHVKNFPGAGQSAGWFDFPFTEIEILTKVTPSLVSPDNLSCKVTEVAGQPIYPPATAVPQRAAFWPMLAPNVNTGNFLFDVVGTDLCGKRIRFAMPMLFVGDEANTGKVGAQNIAANVVAGYNNTPEAPRRTADVGGTIICFAPVDPAKECDPSLPAESLVFTASPVATSDLDVPHFDPHVLAGQCAIRQIQRLLGLTQSVRVEYPDVYKASGFGAGNPGEVFLKLPTPHELTFGGSQAEAKSDSLGALASPAMAIQGMSRIVGPVAAKPPSGGQTVEDTIKKVVGNSFDPGDFFKGAKILGGIDLGSVLTTVALSGTEVPKMLTRELANTIEASFHFETQVKQSDPAKLLVPGAGGPTMLSMDGKVSAPINNPQDTTFNATATLTHFKVNLFGFIIIWFDALTFKASRGTKPDVAVTMHPGDEAITFGGPLEFVNDLRKFIPSNGFSDPPSLSVTPSGIAASYSLNLPSIGVGIFALTNASLGAGFSLPFDSQPVEVKFNFSQREHPFSLTVSLFGGGGFFAIGIGTEGVREIEAALEFGAAIAIDLGVASGGVEVKAGVYFHWLQSSSGKTVELAGYVRLHGELSVLGLISASLTFNLQLSYLKQSGSSTVWGEATLTIEVEVLFLSASVSVKCRREFGGSESDPTFKDLIPAPAVWADYCAAFAAE